MKEINLEVLHDAEVQQHKGNEYHNEVFPTAVRREERRKARFERKLAKGF